MSIKRCPKHPDESFSIEVDFTGRLVSGETVSTATATRLTNTADDVTVGSTSVATPIVAFNVSGGTTGHVTTVKVLATTNTGEVFTALVDVPVNDRSF